jgi:hypothetical protein
MTAAYRIANANVDVGSEVTYRRSG